jgi:hypothetical protein
MLASYAFSGTFTCCFREGRGSTGSIQPGLYSTLNSVSINNSTGDCSDWFLDIGAMAHMASNPCILTTPSTSTVHRHVVVGNGQLIVMLLLAMANSFLRSSRAMPLSQHPLLLIIFI